MFAVGIQMKDLHEPAGWVRVPLSAPVAGGVVAAVAADAAGGAEGPILRAHFVQICVVAMHQNGRDTHIRQVGITFLLLSGPPLLFLSFFQKRPPFWMNT